ncbi:MAG: hypothetical protein QOJ16_1515, partial [Acidobacteriota bacterium]|nr:hypothetical protein [Acidobacteriota bacterium]
MGDVLSDLKAHLARLRKQEKVLTAAEVRWVLCLAERPDEIVPATSL